eukprot:6831242-Pyramimonas_sp.AAC.1
MATSCRCAGPPRGLNLQVNREAWRARCTGDAPRLSSCGQFALVQMLSVRYFLVEQPKPTWLGAAPLWGQVATRPRVGAGVRGPRGLPAETPSVAIASSPHLLTPLRNLRRSGRHDREVNWGRGQRAEALQVWPWRLAERVVQDAVALDAAME